MLRSENSLKTALASLSKNLLSRKGTTNSQEEMTINKKIRRINPTNQEFVGKSRMFDLDKAKTAMLSYVLNFNNSSSKLLTCRVRFTTYSKGLILLMRRWGCSKILWVVKRTARRLPSWKKRLKDLENRSKGNNIVIWIIPWGAEKDSSFQDIVSNILRQHMKLEGDLEIMFAHRTNITR